MRMRLRQAENHTSPSRALEELSRIKLHKVTLATGKVLQGVTSITPEQSDLFAALKVRKPTTKAVNRQLLS